MPARKDEAVGVGGTGASNWSEPMKSSTMGLEDFIPEAVRPWEITHGAIEADKYARERGEDGADVPLPREETDDPLEMGLEDPETADPNEPAPVGTPEERGLIDPEEVDPVAAAVNSVDLSTVEMPSRGKRGRPKGAKTDKLRAARRKNPAAFIRPISIEDQEKIDAYYAEIEAKDVVSPTASDKDEAESDRIRPTEGDVDRSEAESLEAWAAKVGKMRPKYNPYADDERERRPSMLSKDEWAKIYKLWADRDKEERIAQIRKSAKRAAAGRQASVAPMIADPDIAEVSQMKDGKYFFRGNFAAEYPDLMGPLTAKLREMGLSPEDGIFVRLNRDVKKPNPPATLNPADPGYDKMKADAYYGKMLLYRLSQKAKPGSSGNVFWSSKRDWRHDEIEDGTDLKLDGDEWVSTSAIDPSWVPPDEKEEKKEPEYSDEEYGQEYWNTYLDPTGQRRRVVKSKEIHIPGEITDIGALDPKALADVERQDDPTEKLSPTPKDPENWDWDDDLQRYIHKRTGAIYGHRPGLTAWEKRKIAKDPTFFRSHSLGQGKYDPDVEPEDFAFNRDIDPPELKGRRGYLGGGDIKEAIDMRLKDFFIHEAHGQRASERPHGYPRSGPGSEKSYVKTSREQAGYQQHIPDEGGEPGENQFAPQEGDPISHGFDDPGKLQNSPQIVRDPDPSSSQDAEHGGFSGEFPAGTSGDKTAIPGGAGGPLAAPPGVFQDTDGFGSLDQVDDEEQQVTPGSPEDPEVAGSIPDPGFGAEQDDWARESQTGEPRPQDRTKVNFPDEKQRKPRPTRF